jgi:F-type H+-transporting ATPase subunit alpha
MIKTYDEYLADKHETGTILSSQGFTATAQGLPSTSVGELVMTQTGELGMVNALGEDTTELLMIQRGSAAKGEPLVAVGELLSVPVGDALLGRMVTPLGVPLDGKEPLPDMELRPVEVEAPPIYRRAKITKQLVTGVMVSDLLVPLGRGQREVVMGDAKSGKTSFLQQILLHVAEEGMVGIYVGIGKTRAELKRISVAFEEQATIDGKPNVVMVAVSSSDSSTMQYLAPYAGMSVAEYFRDKGQDVFIVLDDLGSHAKAYREMSLLNNRLPGRDSYPGDIFYTHSRLLERAGSIAGKDGQANTITLMPIIETVGGDLTGYVQTNLISMSDGHTLFDLETFYKGVRPAVNIGLSVSRVGKQTQTKLQKKVASDLRTMLAQYGEAKNFVRFGAELTDKTKLLFLRGTLFEELIKQDLKTHLKIEEQLMIMVSLLGGYFDDVPAKQVVALRNVMLGVFRQPAYDDLRQALKDSADDEKQKPLLDAFYTALPAKPTAKEGGQAGTKAASGQAGETAKAPAGEVASPAPAPPAQQAQSSTIPNVPTTPPAVEEVKGATAAPPKDPGKG